MLTVEEASSGLALRGLSDAQVLEMHDVIQDILRAGIGRARTPLVVSINTALVQAALSCRARR